MDHLSRVRSLLERVTYKPGWKLSVERSRYISSDSLLLVVSAEFPDVDRPDRRVTPFTFRKIIEEWCLDRMNDGQVLEYCIIPTIREMEEHEFREWLKLDGFCLYDPHPERKFDEPRTALSA
jgi:hypothetical protein